MLSVLRIRNLAVIEDVTWELGPGFNILTGETGAGKSILIDALQLLLGERADKSLIRDGAEECAVEAVIEPGARRAELEELLQSAGLEAGEEGLFLKRIIARQGSNRQFMNGSPVPLQMLKTIGDLLVDFHGPHDHQSLLQVARQLEALDAFAGIESKRLAFQELFRKAEHIRRSIAGLGEGDPAEWQRQVEFLKFQWEEIGAANLSAQEETSLESEYQAARHVQRILEISGEMQQRLEEGEQPVLESLAQVQKLLGEWERIDARAAALAASNISAIETLRDLLREASGLAEQAELDGGRLGELEQRLDLYQALKKKYGGTVEAVLEQGAKLRERYDALAGREENIRALEKEWAEACKELEQQASQLTKARKKAAPQLSEAITKELRKLGFKQSEFSITLEKAEALGSSGGDRVEFMFAPNPGESPRPLRAIASSGEMARVMLAVKTVLAASDAVPILIFDEVDANVGGETAVAVAEKLRGLAARHQVLCITHLAQVAAAGNRHYQVDKTVKKGRTLTGVTLLDETARREELARMLGGKNDAALALAGRLREPFQ